MRFKYNFKKLVGFGIVVILFIFLKIIRHYYGKTIIDELFDNRNLNTLFTITSFVSLLFPVSFSKNLTEDDLNKAFDSERKKLKEEDRIRKLNERIEKRSII